MSAIGSVIYFIYLPRRFGYARDIGITSQFAEANAANAEISHIAAIAAAAPTAPDDPGGVFRFSFCFDD